MAKIFGQLEKAQCENLAADPASPPDGYFYYNTTSDRFRFYNGAAWIDFQLATNLDSTPGTAGQVLTADGAGASSWATNPSAPDQSYEISNLGIAATVAANALTLALKTKAGADPSGGSVVKIGFRNATAATGTYNQRSVSAALSMVVSSGSTLGTASAYEHFIYVYSLDNAGTVELAASLSLFEEGSIQSTTAEGGAGAADSNAVLYSTTARANVPIRLLGRVRITEATAGTWATAPTEISVMPFVLGKVMVSYGKNTDTTIANATDRYIDFEDKDYDTHNSVQGAGTGNVSVTNTGWKFVAPKTVKYRVTCLMQFTAGTTWSLSERLLLEVAIDSSGSWPDRKDIARSIPTDTGATAGVVGVNGSAIFAMNAGQRLELILSQNTGGNQILNADQRTNWIQIEEV